MVHLSTLLNWFTGGGLRRRFMLGTSLLALVFLLLSAVPAFFYTKYLIERGIKVQLENEAVLWMNSIEQSLTAYVGSIDALAENTLVVNALVDSSERRAYLQPFFRTYRVAGNVDANLVLTDFSGKSIASRYAATDYIDPPWLSQVIDDGIATANIDRRESVYLQIAFPVFYAATGAPEGMLVTEFDTAKLTALGVKLGSDSDLKLLFSNGVAVNQTDRTNDLAAKYLIEKKSLTLPPPLDKLKLEVIVGKDREQAMQPLDRFFTGYFILGLVLIISVLVVTRWLTNLLVQPVLALSEFADNVSVTNNLDREAPVSGRDEVGVLARALNKMLFKLRESRDHLELQVAERTRQLNESESLYRLLANNSGDLITRLDANGVITYASPASMSLLNREQKQLERKPFTEFVDPHDVELFSNVFRNVVDRLGAETTTFRAKKIDDKPIWVESSLRAVRNHDKNNAVEVIVVSRNADERMLAQREIRNAMSKLDALIKNNPMGIVFENSNGMVEIVNEQFISLFSLPKTFDVKTEIARDVDKRISQNIVDGDEFVSKASATREMCLAEFGREVNLRDGRTLEYDYVPIYIEADFIGHMWIYRDVSERKKVERLKNEFVSTVSHELRTPITSIRGSLGLILSGTLGEIDTEIKKMIEIGLRNSERLTLLVNDILDMDKIASGNLRFDIQTYVLPELIEQSIQSTQSFAKQYDVNIQILTDVPLVKIDVDKERFIQVMNNLLSNAIKFSPTNGVVLVKVDRLPDTVRISVVDSGTGIPEEFRNRIFQKFSQADSSDTRQKGGTGLGLAITKALLEKMSGTIDYHSVVNEGTTFFFDLPVRMEEIQNQNKRAM